VLTDAELVALVDEHAKTPSWAGLNVCDLLLIGSRAEGFADAGSDYDLVALSPSDDGRPERSFALDARTADVSVVVLAPAALARREADDFADWAYDICHARLLRGAGGIGTAYREHLAGLWRARRPAEIAALCTTADRALRRAASALRHREALATRLLAAAAATAVLHLVVTAREVGRPNDKWLPRVAARLEPDGPAAVEIAERLTGGGSSSAEVQEDLDRLRALIKDVTT
jgi:hypothetical protein